MGVVVGTPGRLVKASHAAAAELVARKPTPRPRQRVAPTSRRPYEISSPTKRTHRARKARWCRDSTKKQRMARREHVEPSSLFRLFRRRRRPLNRLQRLDIGRYRSAVLQDYQL